MNTLNSQLRDTAISCGLCDQWQSMWSSDRDFHELIAMFRQGQDFAIAHDYPCLPFIRENFPPHVLHEEGIFVDEHLNEHLPSGTYILLGQCSGSLRFQRWSAAVVYVRHDSDITIHADDNARISVRLYDNARVHVTTPPHIARISVRDRRPHTDQ